MIKGTVLNNLPQPLLDDLASGKWLPFVGAGFSKNARLPKGKNMPLWDQLGNALSEEINDYKFSGAIDAISSYEHEYGRPRLIERVANLILVNEAIPDLAHKTFCEIPFDIVCTTNFDFLLEKGYALAKRPVRPIIEEDHLSINSSEVSVNLIKMHGDVHHPSKMVLTEADYDLYLNRNPLMATYISSLLINRTAVFIGYSVDDYDFRQIWQVIGERLGKARRQAYVILKGASQLDISRYARRGIRAVNLPDDGLSYNETLSKLFEEARIYWEALAARSSYYLDENQENEIALRDIRNRLCFLSFPVYMSAFYRENVYPIVEKAGLVPISATDMLTPGDSIAAKIESLISSSAVIIVDIASSWTTYEFNLALKRLGADKVIVILGEDHEIHQIPQDLRRIVYLLRPDDSNSKGLDSFLSILEERLRHISGDLGSDIANQARTLLLGGHFEYAIIAAISALEHVMTRQSLRSKSREKSNRSQLAFVKLVEEMVNLGYLTNEDLEKSYVWRDARNRVVHGVSKIESKLAKRIVQEILDTIAKIPHDDR